MPPGDEDKRIGKFPNRQTKNRKFPNSVENMVSGDSGQLFFDDCRRTVPLIALARNAIGGSYRSFLMRGRNRPQGS